MTVTCAAGLMRLNIKAFFSAVVQQMRLQYSSAGPTHRIMATESGNG